MAAGLALITKVIVSLGTSGFLGRTDIEITRRIVLVNIVCLTGITFLLPMGILALVQANYGLAVFDWITAACLVGIYYLLRKSGNYALAAHAGFCVAMVLYLYLFFTGGVNNSAFVWFYTVPLLALFLLGLRNGTLATIILFVIALVFLFVEPDYPFFTTYSTDIKLRFLPSYIVVAAFAYVFEVMRAKSHTALTARNKEISQTVRTLRATQRELKTAHDELEQRVSNRTAELNSLNLDLTVEIAERRHAEEALRRSNARLTRLHEQLEDKVAQRTAQIVRANLELQNEIKLHKQTGAALKLAKKRAEAASEAKSEFLANMSHELRTPLNHIIGFTELVLGEHFGTLNEVQQDYLTDVKNSSGHLLELINDILDLSKIEAGKLEFNPDPVKLQPLLEKSVTMVAERAAKHQIRITLMLTRLPETINADERKLKQILYNLLSNAVKFTPDGGEVSLHARLAVPESSAPQNPAVPSRVEIEIADTGIGLNAEDVEYIFEPFAQADGSTTRKYEGTGLGLSLTKRLVEMHGGEIWVASDGHGQGSRFGFSMPC